jgi:hypothetical protein
MVDQSNSSIRLTSNLNIEIPSNYGLEELCDGLVGMNVKLIYWKFRNYRTSKPNYVLYCFLFVCSEITRIGMHVYINISSLYQQRMIG